MADNQMLHQSLQFLRKVWQIREFSLEHLEFDDHVAEELALCRIAERSVVGEFVNLADIVEKGTGQKQIAIDLWIVPAHQITGSEQRNNMIQQTADVGVMKRFGGRSIAVCSRYFGISHEGLNESFQMRILDSRYKAVQSLPQFIDIFRC